MNIPLSASAVIAWSPDVDGGETVLFRIKPASLIERAAFRREIAAQGCQFPTQAALLALLRGLLEGYGEAESAEFLAAIDLIEAVEKNPVAPDDADASRALSDALAKLDLLEQTLRRFENPYVRALADRDHWLAVAPLIAAQRFCVGWEGSFQGVELPPFQQRNGAIPLDLLDQLDENLRKLLGFRCLEVATLSGPARKN
jgi:hypothetical protein